MSDQNPWLEFPYDTYIKHMGHENVRQIETLSRIAGDQFSLVTAIPSPVIAILGITDGNGLSHIPRGRCKTIIGMDINAEYLNVCRERYGNIPELKLYRIDLMNIASPQDDDVGEDGYELGSIYLHPDFFRQGIGTLALNFAFNKARNLKKTFIVVWVFAENTNSILFYKKCGFVADGKTKTLAYGKNMSCIRMRRVL